MASDDRVKFEASLTPADEDGPARLYIWVRRFHGDEDTTELRSARAGFAEILGRQT